MPSLESAPALFQFSQGPVGAGEGSWARVLPPGGPCPPGKLVFPAPRQTEEDAARSIWRQVKSGLHLGLSGGWRGQEVLGGRAGPGQGPRELRLQRHPSPADPSQKQESPYLAGKGVHVGMSVPNTKSRRKVGLGVPTGAVESGGLGSALWPEWWSSMESLGDTGPEPSRAFPVSAQPRTC